MELPLAALSEFEARALLVRQGLRDDPRAAAITRWAGGLPLALRLGAAAAREDPTWMPGSDAAPLRAHLQRVSEVALAGEHADVFALACVARVVTPGLVADVLPGVDPAAALRWLAGCAFADARPGGVTLHELVRRPLRATLEPERERALRARVADSLHARALDDLTLTIDLADLVEDPAVRAGYSWDGGVDHHITGPGPERLAPDAATQAFFDSEPGHVLVARDAESEPRGYAIAFAADTSSALAHADPRLGRWLAHARGREAIVWRDSVSHLPRVQALLNMATILRSGLRNPRYAYLPIDPRSRAALAFSAAVGAQRVPELDFGGWECHVLDYGPSGLLGAQRDLVRRELGLAEPAVDVREALRNLRRPGGDAVRTRL